MKSFRFVATGGTFDILHKGHYALLSKAFQVGGHVIIGVTSDEFALQRKPNEKLIYRYCERVKNLEEAISSKFGKVEYTISKLDNIYGPTVLSNRVEAIVSSYETKSNASEINIIRKKRGLQPLKIITIPTIRSQDAVKISSSRIRAGLIDEDGKLI
jgi:pantetheine-phosphate adenylyltransferase